MEVQKKSIWGKWWEPTRKWFYPTWLIYETSIRFHEYAQDIYNYIDKHQQSISSYIGGVATEALAIFCSVATFAICTAFLTVPTCFILYKFFNENNLTGTRFEAKAKMLL